MTLNQSKLEGGRGHSGRSIITVSIHSQISNVTDDKLILSTGILVNSNISTYMTGSSLIALGLTWWQAIICKATLRMIGRTSY